MRSVAGTASLRRHNQAGSAIGAAPSAARIASPSGACVAAGENEGAGPLVTAPGGVEGSGGGEEHSVVADVDGLGPVDDRRGDRI